MLRLKKGKTIGLVLVALAASRRGDVARGGGCKRQARLIARGSPARPDALHEREPVVAEHRPEPREELGLRDGARRVRVRDAVPLRPAQGQVHPVARHEREVDVEDDVRHERSGQGVKWSDGKTMTPQDVKYSFDLAKIATHPQHPLWADTGLKSTKVVGQHGGLHVRRQPGLPAVRLLPLQRRDRPAARLQELQQHGHRDRQPRRHEEDRRHRPVRSTSPVSAHRPTTVVWKKRDDWWATKALGLKVAPTYVGRHQERHERRGALEPARREHRPLQQLRTEVRDQGQVQDVLLQGARTTSARTRRGCSRTRRRSRSTTRSSVARWPRRST